MNIYLCQMKIGELWINFCIKNDSIYKAKEWLDELAGGSCPTCISIVE